jgi:broad specificity phosphatase PhoE
MRITFARHGESEANIERVFSNTGWKHGLTAYGRQQAAVLAEKLGDQGVTRIYTSPLKRAVETAEIISSYLGIAYEDTPALIEFSVGDYEGRKDNLAWDEYARVENAWLIEGEHDARIANGECHRDILTRMKPFVDCLIDIYGDTDEHLLLIGHGGTFVCSLPWLLKNIDVEFALANPLYQTAYVAAELREENLICVEWGGIPISP